MRPDQQLTGQALADRYAVLQSFRFRGKVWAFYEGGGWITYQGDGLPGHPTLPGYPHGWSLMDRVRCGAARTEIARVMKLWYPDDPKLQD